MARSVGVSRPTMREVLRILVAEGLLRRHPTTRILQVPTLSPEEVADLYAARLVLELTGIDAAATVPEEAFEPLRASLEDMGTAVRQGEVYDIVRADGRCHTETVALAGIRHLTEFHHSIMTKLNLTLAMVEHSDVIDNDAMLRNHVDYCQLIFDRRVDEAKDQLRTRLASAERAVLTLGDRRRSWRCCALRKAMSAFLAKLVTPTHSMMTPASWAKPASTNQRSPASVLP